MDKIIGKIPQLIIDLCGLLVRFFDKTIIDQEIRQISIQIMWFGEGDIDIPILNISGKIIIDDMRINQSSVIALFVKLLITTMIIWVTNNNNANPPVNIAKRYPKIFEFKGAANAYQEER